LITWETVATDTLACAATSRIVVTYPLLPIDVRRLIGYIIGYITG
jgi:hypothetical protein